MKLKTLAKFMHDAYEYEARRIGWKTQEDCQVPYEDLPPKNREVMERIARAVSTLFTFNGAGQTRILKEWYAKHEVKIE